ncbi:hypothetical protein GBA52_022475 [Prunus armeniaca]|nr:hypothetical protein GBA52_022475 [Prunus armeniaca]
MEKGGETTPSAGLYGDRGVGGKLRKPPSRKPSTTPYARPPLSQAERGRRRWLSSVVDPAYRLIAGGATRLFPSFFSKSNSLSALPPPNVQNHDEWHTETEQNATGDEDHCDLNNGISRTSETAGPSKADGLKSGSDFDGDKKGAQSDEIGLSEIEQLLKGKKFSRQVMHLVVVDEVNHLMEIIHSRAVEHPTVDHENRNQTISTAENGKGVLITDDFPKTSSEDKQEDLNKAIWGTSTPLPQSAIRDEVGASPIEIARAYMGSRTSEIDFSSENTVSKDERAILHGDEFSSKPFIPTPSSKPSTCWPGSMVKDQRDYLTPQTEGGRFGLQSFPRTPYSRTIYSKSKSKLTQLQSGNDKAPRTLSTPWKQSQTPMYGQPRDDALDGGYGSVGPIRKSRHKIVAQTPTRGSPYVHSSPIGSSRVENSNVTKGFLPASKKNFESVGLSGNSQIPASDKKASALSSLIARTILEHIDRNQPTPKDKSEELKLAIAWKKPLSSGVASVNQNGHDSLPLVGGSSSRKLINQDFQKNSAHENAYKGNSLFKIPPLENTVKATDVVNTSPLDFPKIGLNAVGSEVPNQQKKPPSQSSATKRVFPSIAIDKPDSKWAFSSGNSSGFTFPVSTSSAVFSEPPTPSLMPSFLGSSQQHQLKDVDAVPTYEFGSKKSAPLAFSFPSTSAEIQNDDASDIKFSFGSDKPTLAFGSIGKVPSVISISFG